MKDFEKGDQVIILDRHRHPTKIRGVIVGFVKDINYNVLLTNGLSKGKIKMYKIYDLLMEKNHVLD